MAIKKKYEERLYIISLLVGNAITLSDILSFQCEGNILYIVTL